MVETQTGDNDLCGRCALRREYELGLQTLDAKIDGHLALSAERFEAVKLRFNERDIRFNQQSADHQAIITASLTTTQRQVEQLAATALELGSLSQKVAALESRREGSNQAVGWIITLAGLLVTAVLGLAALLISHVIAPGIVVH